MRRPDPVPSTRHQRVPVFPTVGNHDTTDSEHNFQIARADGRTYVVSGAGGKLREQLPHGFDPARTEAWAMQAHVVLVELSADSARLTPVSGLRADGSPHLMTALPPDNEVLWPPFVVTP
jgi:hypothetical protein